MHKGTNTLDKLPSSLQGRAKGMIHDTCHAEGRAEAMKVCALFRSSFEDKYPEAIKFLLKDEQSLFGFYDFPAAHWQHIRGTNVIESVFATALINADALIVIGLSSAVYLVVAAVMAFTAPARKVNPAVA